MAVSMTNYFFKGFPSVFIDNTVGYNHFKSGKMDEYGAVSYTHLRAHETVLDLVCRLLLETKKNNKKKKQHH